jgi:hypothetical protein
VGFVPKDFDCLFHLLCLGEKRLRSVLSLPTFCDLGNEAYSVLSCHLQSSCDACLMTHPCEGESDKYDDLFLKENFK